MDEESSDVFKVHLCNVFLQLLFSLVCAKLSLLYLQFEDESLKDD